MKHNLCKFLRFIFLTFFVSFSVNAGDFRIQDTNHKIAYIENILLPRIQKVNSHEAYLSYEAFVVNEGTGYFPGQDINQYWKEVWRNINQPQIYNLEDPISRDTDHKIAYIQNILLPRIQKISSNEAYWTYGSFIRNDGTGYLPGRDINQYWKDMWGNINQPSHLHYNELSPIAIDEKYKISDINSYVLPKIRQLSGHPAYLDYKTFNEHDGTNYTVGMSISDYLRDHWPQVDLGQIKIVEDQLKYEKTIITKSPDSYSCQSMTVAKKLPKNRA